VHELGECIVAVAMPPHYDTPAPHPQSHTLPQEVLLPRQSALFTTVSWLQQDSMLLPPRLTLPAACHLVMLQASMAATLPSTTGTTPLTTSTPAKMGSSSHTQAHTTPLCGPTGAAGCRQTRGPGGSTSNSHKARARRHLLHSSSRRRSSSRSKNRTVGPAALASGAA
jgi:hypothetical protein